MRERVRRACQQRQCESELAARPASCEQRNAAARQATDPGEVIDRRSAQPWLRGRQLGRPGQRLAAKADPNRINRQLKLLCLHLFLGLGEDAGEKWRQPRLYRTLVRESRGQSSFLICNPSEADRPYQGSCSDSPDGPAIG